MLISFSKYLNIETILISLEELDIKEEQKHHLIKLVDSSFHHRVYDEILSQLPAEDKKIFIYHLSSPKNEDQITQFLNERIDDLDQKLKNLADELIEQFCEDVREAKRLT